MTYGIPESIDRKQHFIDTMPYIWRTKPNVYGLIQALGESYQDLEDTCIAILNTATSIYNATGEQLDTIGLILDVDRAGRIDEVYRTALLSKASVREASGTTRDIKRISKAVTGATTCKVFNHYPLSTYVFVNAPVNRAEAEAIELAHMASVRTRIMWTIADNYVRTIPTSNLSRLYAECGEPEMECGADLAEAGGYVDTDEPQGYPSGFGFTSLVEGATSYEVVDDKGKMCTLSSPSDSTFSTGLIIDHDGNYIVTETGDYIRYIE